MNKLRIQFLIFIFVPFLSFGQKMKLKPGVKLDTLCVMLNLDETIDEKLKKELQFQFDSTISAFNSNGNSFFIKLDSNARNKFIKFELEKIKYVGWKKNVWVTALDIAALTGTILIFPHFPLIIPFWLMPATYSEVKINCEPELFKKTEELLIAPNGYFTKKDKQTFRFKKEFNIVFYKFFTDLSKQNKKNNKP